MKNMPYCHRNVLWTVFVANLLLTCSWSFHLPTLIMQSTKQRPAKTSNALQLSPEMHDGVKYSRRSWMQRFFVSIAVFGNTSTGVTLSCPAKALAAATDSPQQRLELDRLIYTLLRVREATQQEQRLIRTGKFKDVQRANVKLAINCIVYNYKLSDAFVAASAYLNGNDRRMQAGQVGQGVVQNLITILEYYDAADVQNLKVGASLSGGKEELVLKGLEAAQRDIEVFLSYFDADVVNRAAAQVQQENELNVKEFDKTLGDLINVPFK